MKCIIFGGHSWTKMLFENTAGTIPANVSSALTAAGLPERSAFPSSMERRCEQELERVTGSAARNARAMHERHTLCACRCRWICRREGDKELYVRWLEFAQYTPIFRPHGTALYEVDPNAFSFPSEIALIDDPYRLLLRKLRNNAIGYCLITIAALIARL